jgi:hypothetical protein
VLRKARNAPNIISLLPPRVSASLLTLRWIFCRDILDGMTMLQASPDPGVSGAWSSVDASGLMAWVAQFNKWVQENHLSKSEAKASNNHGTWHDLLAIGLAIFTADASSASKVCDNYLTTRIAEQVQPAGAESKHGGPDGGALPEEDGRTNSESYHSMDADGLLILAQLCLQLPSTPRNLLTARVPCHTKSKGKAKWGEDLCKADPTKTVALADVPRWAAPFVRGDAKWPFVQISSDDAPYYWAEVFRRAANLFGNSSYEDIVQSLPGGGVSPKYVLDLIEPYTGPPRTKTDDVIDKRLRWFVDLTDSNPLAPYSKAVSFLLDEHSDVCTGVLPCCGEIRIQANGSVGFKYPDNVTNRYEPFLRAGKTVHVTINGKSAEIDAAFAHKEVFVAEVQALALRLNLTGLTLDFEDGSGDNITKWISLWGDVRDALHQQGQTLGNCVCQAVWNRLPNATGSKNYGGANASAWTFLWDIQPQLKVFDFVSDMSTYPMFPEARGGDVPAYNNLHAHNCTYNKYEMCGLKGYVRDLLRLGANPSSGQASPAVWLGGCVPNGTLNGQGWNQDTLRQFLSFLDTVGIRSVDVWSGGAHPESAGHCPWEFTELKRWIRRKIDDRAAPSLVSSSNLS